LNEDMTSDSELPWLRVRFADGREVEVHSPNAIQIYEDSFAASVSEQLDVSVSKEDAELRNQPAREEDAGGEVPSIKAQSGTTANLRLLLASSWAAKGRRVTEFVEALKANAVPDESRKVADRLANLVKAGQARRVQTPEGYCYFPMPLVNAHLAATE
jgi:hypothetical protein